MPARRSAILSMAIAASLAAWFLWHTWPGLFFGFSGDDTMNAYLAWDIPISRILVANLTPFTDVYRPAGTAFYRILYAFAGYDPLPFRIACYALLLLNVWITYRFVKTLTNSAEAGVLAALIAAYHPNLIDLYTNGGTIYDILCYTFFVGAATLYIAQRRTFAFFALSILALNSKEMAATLPLALWAYELIHAPSRAPSAFFRRKLPLWILTLATPIAIVIKRASPAFINNSDYALNLTGSQILLTTRNWMSQLVFLPETTLGSTAAVVLLLFPLAIGLAIRHKPLQFLGLLIVLLPLPVNFINLRGFFVMYLPLAAWAACGAILLRAVARRLPFPILVAATAAILLTLYSRDTYRSFEWVDPTQTNNRVLHDALLRSCPQLPEGGHILLRGDAFEKQYFDALFVARLTFHSKTVDVERTKTAPELPPTPGRHYDCVLAYDDTGYVREPLP